MARGMRIFACISRILVLVCIIWVLLIPVHISTERIGGMSQEDFTILLAIIGIVYFIARRIFIIPQSIQWLKAWSYVGFVIFGCLTLAVLAAIGWIISHRLS